MSKRKAKISEGRTPAAAVFTQSSEGPGLFTSLYLALLVQAFLFSFAVWGAAPERKFYLWGAWAACAIALFFAAAGRKFMSDFYETLGAKGKIFFYLIALAIFLVRLRMDREGGVPAAALWVLPYLLLWAVAEKLVRRIQGMLIAAFWLLGWGAHPPAIEFASLFGAATLWVLASAHFAFMGEPFGLSGWWPLKRTLQVAAIYAVPAAIAAWFAAEMWDSAGAWNRPRLGDWNPGEIEIRPEDRVSAEELESLLIKTMIGTIALAATLGGLLVMRRLLAKRAKPAHLPQLQGASVGEIELAARETAEAARPALKGRRGEIARLWVKWAREAEARGVARRKGETAAELAERVAAAGNEMPPPPEEMTRLFEAAHYGPAEPAPADVARMKELTR